VKHGASIQKIRPKIGEPFLAPRLASDVLD
jgi:hypothetical protein